MKFNPKKTYKKYALSFEQIKTEFNEIFEFYLEKEKSFSVPIVSKIDNLTEGNQEVKEVINKLPEDDYQFNVNDNSILAIFNSKINLIVNIADRINNFKQGVNLEDGSTLELFKLFNELKEKDSFNSIDFTLNQNLRGFLPHLYSIIKNIQSPEEYPVYYPYWRNILKDVFSKDKDYDTLCREFRKLPNGNRNLEFGAYYATVGNLILKELQKEITSEDYESKDWSKVFKTINHKPYQEDVLDFNETSSDKKYWIYAPGEKARFWDSLYSSNEMSLGWDKIGDLDNYQSKEEIQSAIKEAYRGETSKTNDARANVDFKESISIGDVIIVKNGRHELLGYGEVTSDYFYLQNEVTNQKRRKVNWLKKGNWQVDFSLALKTLTDITSYSDDRGGYDKYYEMLLGIMNGENQKDNPKPLTMKHALNTILYGPPGTGKTYNTARYCAEILTGEDYEGREEKARILFNNKLGSQIEFVTFHQNYSYEDFIQGLRPDTDSSDNLSFVKTDGVFKKISDRAKENIEEANKAPEEVSKKKQFRYALDDFIDSLADNDGIFDITNNCQVYEVEDDAFRYKGENWNRHSNGIRMKFEDLEKFFLANVKSRKEIKSLDNISALSKQHATYYFGVYQEIVKHVKNNKSENNNQKTQEQNYIIVIDEINRANISRVFGELITLIEEDKRIGGHSALKCTLPSGDVFQIPPNLYILGTMNTADKSIALLDIALRRRFEFIPLYPKPELAKTEDKKTVLEKLNAKIFDDKGPDFQIGHAYVMKDDSLVDCMNKKIIPLLTEYYMNATDEVRGLLKDIGFETTDKKEFPIKVKAYNG